VRRVERDLLCVHAAHECFATHRYKMAFCPITSDRENAVLALRPIAAVARSICIKVDEDNWSTVRTQLTAQHRVSPGLYGSEGSETVGSSQPAEGYEGRPPLDVSAAMGFISPICPLRASHDSGGNRGPCRGPHLSRDKPDALRKTECNRRRVSDVRGSRAHPAGNGWTTCRHEAMCTPRAQATPSSARLNSPGLWS
jgi:hypothetical protein